MIKYADTYTLKICAYKNYLICTTYDTPKRNIVGIGTSLINFNKNDVHISPEALILLKNGITKDTGKLVQNTGLIIYNKTKLFWASYDNIILNIKDATIYDIPIHTEIVNDVDDKIKKQLDNIEL